MNTAYEETVRLAKLIFQEIYEKRFSNRKEFDNFTSQLVKDTKQPDTEYTYSSLYLSKHSHFTFHIKVVCNRCYSVITFSFCMIRGDSQFSNGNISSVSINIGTPAYWYGNESMFSEPVKEKEEMIL